jgi:hypothetical protein
MNQILTLDVPLGLLENSPVMKEVLATLFIILWVTLVTGAYAIVNLDPLNESTLPRSMLCSEEKSLTW